MNIKTIMYYKLKYPYQKFIKLPKNEQLLLLNNFIKDKYNIDNFPSSFYESLLILISQNKKNFKRILLANDIYSIIDLIKNTSSFNDISKYIDPITYLEIPKKHITNLVSKLHSLNNLSNLDNILSTSKEYLISRTPTYLEEEYIILSYKMYKLFGYNNSLDILNKQYGDISYNSLYFLIYSINYPLPKELFLNFLFKNKKDPENIMHQIISGKSPILALNFPYLYKNFDTFISLYGSNISKNTIEDILKTRYISSNPFHPEISEDIIKDMIPSYLEKSHSYDDNTSSINKVNINYYEEYLQNNTTSSIPQIITTYNNLTCTILSKNSPELLVIGYRNNNCYRLNGEAFILFRKSTKSKHTRILKIENESKETIAMMLIIRNGNTLVGQGIEISKHSKEDISSIYSACKQTLKELMDYMNNNNDEIVATIIGNSNYYTQKFQPNTLPFRITPIVEGNQFLEYYDGFNFYQSLLDIKENKKISDIKSFIPTTTYYDPREEILHITKEDYEDYNYLLATKRIFAISTITNTVKERQMKLLNNSIKEIYCNTDWYIIVLENGEIIGSYLDNDIRAKEEYTTYLNIINNTYSLTLHN